MTSDQKSDSLAEAIIQEMDKNELASNSEPANEVDPELAKALRRQEQTAAVLMKHFQSHPQSVMIVSLGLDGTVNCDVTTFPSLEKMVFSQRMLMMFLDDLFERNMTAHAKESAEKLAERR